MWSLTRSKRRLVVPSGLLLGTLGMILWLRLSSALRVEDTLLLFVLSVMCVASSFTLLLLPMVYQLRANRRLASESFGRCHACGYSKRGLPSGRCPECGTAGASICNPSCRWLSVILIVACMALGANLAVVVHWSIGLPLHRVRSALWSSMLVRYVEAGGQSVERRELWALRTQKELGTINGIRAIATASSVRTIELMPSVIKDDLRPDRRGQVTVRLSEDLVPSGFIDPGNTAFSGEDSIAQSLSPLLPGWDVAFVASVLTLWSRDSSADAQSLTGDSKWAIPPAATYTSLALAALGGGVGVFFGFRWKVSSHTLSITTS